METDDVFAPQPPQPQAVLQTAPLMFPAGMIGYPPMSRTPCYKTYTTDFDYDDEMMGPPPPTDEEFDLLHPLPVKKMYFHPGLFPAFTKRGREVVFRVLNLPELLEMILENLDIQTLILSQRVNRRFGVNIHSSLKLQKLLHQAVWDPKAEREKTDLEPFYFNNLLTNHCTTARNLGFIVTRHARGDSGLWEFRVWITTSQLLKPPVRSSVYWAHFCTPGYRSLEIGPELWEEDKHVIKVYYKDMDPDKPLLVLNTMQPSMNHVYHYMEYFRPHMVTTEEELHGGITLGGFAYERFMDGRAYQAKLVAEDVVRAEAVVQNTRIHRAVRRAGKLGEASSSSSS